MCVRASVFRVVSVPSVAVFSLVAATTAKATTATARPFVSDGAVERAYMCVCVRACVCGVRVRVYVCARVMRFKDGGIE